MRRRGGVSALTVLGRAARAARRAGLGRALAIAVAAADAPLRAVARPPLSASVDGLELRGYLRHRSFLAHLARGDYEPYSRELFRAELRPGRLVVDAGAHVGLYSALACRAGARVVAIEPDAYNVAALSRNLAACDAARIVAKAVGGAPGRATFHVSAGTIGSSLRERPTGPGRDVTVELTTVDEELRGEEVRDPLVKLDLEGAEAWALEGMAETVARAEAIVLLLEVNPAALAAFGESPPSLFARLGRLGFECAYVDEGRRELVPVREGAVTKGNLLCRAGAR